MYQVLQKLVSKKSIYKRMVSRGPNVVNNFSQSVSLFKLDITIYFLRYSIMFS